MMDPREDIVMSGSQDNAHVAQNGFINPQDLHPDMAFAEPQPDPAAQSLSEELVQVDMPLTEEEKKAKARREANARRLLPTGCCYDARMKLHQNADFTFEPHHPEDPKRIQSIFNTFVDNGLVYVGNPKRLAEIMVVSPNKYMWRISARAATRPEICSIHTHEHFEWVESLVNMDGEKLKELSRSLDTGKTSLYVGHFTQQAALISCGGAIETCKNVVDGTLKNAIAIIRPPGHHAECANGMGFCFYNNVAVATRICQADYPNICRKVLILDWDVHHGNGTQNMFYDDPNVLYISIHVWKGGEMYPGWPEPGSGHSDATENSVGEGRGVGKNVNIPWITAGMGDGEYMAAFQRIVMPIAQEFGPDLVIISAGFDAAAGDELGGCFVSPACYSQMTHMLMSLAGGKVAVCLEGGYNLEAISNSALAVAQTLMGTPPEPLDLPPINTLALQVLNSVRRAHAEYWECMRPRKVDIPKDIEDGVLTLDVAIRRAQYTELREKHNMVELQMVHDNAEIVRIFKHQILMTPGLKSAKKIYLAAHDEYGYPNAFT